MLENLTNAAPIRRLEASDTAAVDALLARNHQLDQEAMAATEEIVADVRTRGMDALYDLTLRFDGARVVAENFRVSQEEIRLAYGEVAPETVAALTRARDNIHAFHLRQKAPSQMEADAFGNVTGQMVRALARVGCYVPGGTAAYPSSVLMTAVPAAVAGVDQIVMVSPPDETGKLNPVTLVAADLAGVHQIYKVGGAQAVAALAYGAGELRPVDKIVGPGNIYVTLAKKLVYGTVDIDMLAGPSEILVVADGTADPAFVAADLLSQAEHDRRAAAILLTDCKALARSVRAELSRQLADLARADMARASLKDNGAIVMCDSIAEAIELANRFAPEHLELCVAEPFSWLGKVRHAGAVFLGHHTPEPLGDYFAGPNHVLPTSGTARFYSPLNLDTYRRKMSVLSYTKEGLLACGDDVARLADEEGLGAHARAVRLRMDRLREADR